VLLTARNGLSPGTYLSNHLGHESFDSLEAVIFLYKNTGITIRTEHKIDNGKPSD
jgi:hypothetical protein